MIVKMTILRLLGSSDNKEKEKGRMVAPTGVPSAPVEPVMHRNKASVQPVVTVAAVRSSTATSWLRVTR